ncbi:hypothetical protein OY671_009123, partial [Metschnikowia pulcherrima]
QEIAVAFGRDVPGDQHGDRGGNGGTGHGETPGAACSVLCGVNPSKPRASLAPQHPPVRSVMAARCRRICAPQHTPYCPPPAMDINSPDVVAEVTVAFARYEAASVANHVEVSGNMPPYSTATGFSIIPVVSSVTPGFQSAPDAFEVAEVF